MEKNIIFEDKEILLESVAEKDNTILYRYLSNAYINGATVEEIKEEFPDYDFPNMERCAYDYVFEKDGKLLFKDPDE